MTYNWAVLFARPTRTTSTYPCSPPLTAARPPSLERTATQRRPLRSELPRVLLPFGRSVPDGVADLRRKRPEIQQGKPQPGGTRGRAQLDVSVGAFPASHAASRNTSPFSWSFFAPIATGCGNSSQNDSQIVPSSCFNSMLRTIEESAQDLSVSRPLSRVPWAIDVDERDGVYVWIDALTNYLTTSENRSIDAVLHVFGKDIAKFHCYFYPCLLLALRIPSNSVRS